MFHATQNSFMKILLFLPMLVLTSYAIFAQDKKTPVQITSPDKQFELVGELGEKLGSTFTVRGIIFDGPSIRIQRRTQFIGSNDQ